MLSIVKIVLINFVIATGEYDVYAARKGQMNGIAAGHAVAQNAGAIIKTLDENLFYMVRKIIRYSLIKRAENLND